MTHTPAAEPAPSLTGAAGSPKPAPRGQQERFWDTLRPTLVPLLAGYLALSASWCGFGFLLRSDAARSIRDFDERVAQAMVARRTPTWDSVAFYVSYVADTFVKIGATALLAVLFWWAWRRWQEPLLLALSLILEAAVFLTVTRIVQRPRPAVARLEESPINSSFPSGHTAAAAVYAALTIILFRHCQRRSWRIVAVAASLVVPTMVATARVYAGMHAVSDVVGGILLGFACLAAVTFILRYHPFDPPPDPGDHAPHHRRGDLARRGGRRRPGLPDRGSTELPPIGDGDYQYGGLNQ